MKSVIRWVVLAAALGVVAAAVGACGSSSSSSTTSSSAATSSSSTASSGTTAATAPTKGTIQVDIVADLTGPLAGSSSPQGALAYFDMINSEGGVDGYKIKAVQYDSGSNPGTAVQAFRRAISDNPAAIMEMTSADVSAIPALAASGIPAIGQGFVPGWTGHPNMFSPIGDVSTHLSDAWIRIIKHFAGASKIAIITSPVEEADANLTASEGPETGTQIKLNLTGLPEVFTSAEALSVAQRMKAAGVNGVITYAIFAGESELQADLNNLGGSPITVQEASEYGPTVLKEFGNRINGELFVENWVTPYVTNNAGVEQFKAAMTKAGFAKEIYTQATATLAWTQAALLVDRGLKIAGAPFSRAAVIKGLSETKNYTANGMLPNTTFPQFQQVGTRCLSVMKVENGQWVSLVNGSFPFYCGGPSLPTIK